MRSLKEMRLFAMCIVGMRCTSTQNAAQINPDASVAWPDAQGETESEAESAVICEEMSYSQEEYDAAFEATVAELTAAGYEIIPFTREDTVCNAFPADGCMDDTTRATYAIAEC